MLYAIKKKFLQEWICALPVEYQLKLKQINVTKKLKFFYWNTKASFLEYQPLF